MKVLMFGWEFPPFNSGGLGTHCYGLTKALSKRKVEITFVMPATSQKIQAEFVRIVKAGRKKILQVPVSLSPYRTSLESVEKLESSENQVYGWDFFDRVKKYTEAAYEIVRNEEFDLVHSHDWMTFLVGARISEERKKPFLVTLHSTEFDRTGGLSPNPWIVEIERYGMEKADKIITVSNYMKSQIVERYGIPEEKIQVIYNGIDPDAPNERIKFGLPEKTVLFLGRLTVQKGPDYFLYAAKRVLEMEKNVRFIVVGDGYMLPDLIQKSVELGIADRVHFTGYVESVDEFYRMADLYVMPSVSEPFGIVALEALARGTPVIVSKQSGVSEILNHCLKVDFWDVEELANKIISSLRYPPLLEEMRRNGKKEIEGLTWDSVAERTLQVYESLINQFRK